MNNLPSSSFLLIVAICVMAMIVKIHGDHNSLYKRGTTPDPPKVEVKVSCPLVDINTPIMMEQLIPGLEVTGDLFGPVMKSGIINGVEYFVLAFDYEDAMSDAEDMIVVVFTKKGLRGGELTYFRIAATANIDITVGTNEIAVAGTTGIGGGRSMISVYFVTEDTVNGGVILGQFVEILPQAGETFFGPRLAHNPNDNKYLIAYSSDTNILYSILDPQKNKAVTSAAIPNESAEFDVVYGGDVCNCFDVIISGDSKFGGDKAIFHWIVDENNMPAGPIIREDNPHDSSGLGAAYHPISGFIGIMSFGLPTVKRGFSGDTTEFFLREIDASLSLNLVDSARTLDAPLDVSGLPISMDIIPNERGTFLGVSPSDMTRLLYITVYQSDTQTFKVVPFTAPDDNPEQPAIAYGSMSCTTALAFNTERDSDGGTVWLFLFGNSMERMINLKPGQCGRRI